MEKQEALMVLGSKLSNITEKAWTILVQQAFTESVINLVQYAIAVVYCIILYKLHIKFSKPKHDDEDRTYYHNDFIVTTMFFGGVVAVIFVFAIIFSISDTVNGFLNPEYWALNKILKSLK